jgi:hypothetical protein
VAVAVVSRITVTLITPGYCISDSISRAISLVNGGMSVSLTCDALTKTRSSRPACSGNALSTPPWRVAIVCSCSRRSRYVASVSRRAPGPRRGDGVGADGEHGEVGRRFLVKVVGLHRVDDAGIDSQHPQKLAPDDRVHTLDVVVDRLADVVEHARLAG